MSENSGTRATLLVSCPDRTGLVAALASLLSDHGANILRAQQHRESLNSMFFQRIEFDCAGLDISREELESLLGIECGRYDMQWKISYGDQPKRVAIFVSKFEHCLSDLLLRLRIGELNCRVPVIISNHPELKSIADANGIRFEVFPITKENKQDQEQREIELLNSLEIDLVVLARYMQILSPTLIGAFSNRIINIHHSFLPAFVGAKPYHQAYERGVKLIGATAHFATTDLDEGPIIAQDVEACSHRDSAKDLVRKGRDVERVVLARAVRAFMDDRILVNGRRSVVFE